MRKLETLGKKATFQEDVGNSREKKPKTYGGGRIHFHREVKRKGRPRENRTSRRADSNGLVRWEEGLHLERARSIESMISQKVGKISELS